MKPDYKKIANGLLDKAKGQITSFAEGAQADIQNFMAEITTGYAVALEKQDKAMVMELDDQLSAIGEKYRLRMAHEHWSFVRNMITTTFEVAIDTVGYLLNKA